MYRDSIFALRDEKYKAFQQKLIPDMDESRIIGVPAPKLRALAKTADISFLQELPHSFFEEDNLHAFIIEGIKNFDTCVSELQRFLPYVDNWATCDMLSPAVFKKNKQKLLPYVLAWLKSQHTYTVRYGIGMLMKHYLGEEFSPEYPKLVAEIKSDEYYVNMMRAWYFTTALTKRYDDVICFFTQKKLDTFTHNKALQKAVESKCFTAEQKQYFRSLKIK